MANVGMSAPGCAAPRPSWPRSRPDAFQSFPLSAAPMSGPLQTPPGPVCSAMCRCHRVASPPLPRWVTSSPSPSRVGHHQELVQSSAGKDLLVKTKMKITKQPESAGGSQQGRQQVDELPLNLGWFSWRRGELLGTARHLDAFSPQPRSAVSLLSPTPAPTWLCPWGPTVGTTRTQGSPVTPQGPNTGRGWR